MFYRLLSFRFIPSPFVLSLFILHFFLSCVPVLFRSYLASSPFILSRIRMRCRSFFFLLIVSTYSFSCFVGSWISSSLSFLFSFLAVFVRLTPVRLFFLLRRDTAFASFYFTLSCVCVVQSSQSLGAFISVRRMRHTGKNSRALRVCWWCVRVCVCVCEHVLNCVCLAYWALLAVSWLRAAHITIRSE